MKKTEFLTLRLSPETKEAINKEAIKREWTTSHMAEKIISEWAERKTKDEG